MLFDGKKSREQREEAERCAKRLAQDNQVQVAAPLRPTVIEHLKKRRSEKIELRKRLDRDIEMLDHDITYVELNPQGVRLLEFIAARFKGEETGGTENWKPVRD